MGGELWVATLRRAGAEFDRRLRRVTRTDWRKPTPCAEWDVYALVNHVVVGGWRYGRVLQGGSLAQFVSTRNADVLGMDALGEWDRARQFSESAFAEPGALDRRATIVVGEVSGADLLCVRLFELTVHTWDLARALGLDENLDASVLDAAERGRQVLAPLAQRPDIQWFDDLLPVDPGETAQGRLLRLAGRRP